MRWVQPEFLYLLILLPIYWGAEYWLEQWRRRARQIYAEGQFHGWLVLPASQRRRLLKIALWSLAWTALVAAAARPQGAPVLVERASQTRTIYLVVDCSLSMRTQDLPRGRMAAAKQAMRGVIARNPQDRLGLIGFAGEARMLCPATTDHQALTLLVDQVNTRIISQPGSDPAAGVSMAMAKLNQLPGQGKVVLLFSDGEATRARDWLDAGQRAAAQGIKIISVGLGTAAGGPIPLGRDFWGKTTYRKFKGRLVQSRLTSLSMRKAAKFSGGYYVTWTSLPEVMKALSRALKRVTAAQPETETVWAYYEYFPWFVILAFLVLLLEILIPLQRSRLA